LTISDAPFTDTIIVDWQLGLLIYNLGNIGDRNWLASISIGASLTINESVLGLLSVFRLPNATEMINLINLETSNLRLSWLSNNLINNFRVWTLTSNTLQAYQLDPNNFLQLFSKTSTGAVTQLFVKNLTQSMINTIKAQL